MKDLVYEGNVGTCKDLVRRAIRTVAKRARMGIEADGGHFEHVLQQGI
jgi:hypothetical protein